MQLPKYPPQPPENNPCLDAALEYLDRGFSVIPVRRADKKPYIKWEEFQHRIPTVDEVERWWTQWPEANVAIVTGSISNLFIVDSDGDAGTAYMTDNLPKASVYSKTSRGVHAVYLPPKNSMIRNTVRLSKEIDIRGEGGYFVAPPSVHASGHVYHWIFPEGMDGWDGLVEYQPPTAKLGTGPGNLNIDLSGVKKAPINAPVAAGSRNDTLAQLSGRWVSLGLEDHEIEVLARKWNQDNQPPLGEKELLKTLESIRKTHEKNHPAVETTLIVPDLTDRRTVEPFPDYLLNPGGILQEILDYIASMCPVSIPTFNLGCAMALLGAVGGHKICGPTGIRTNLYCLLLGHSGSGKDGAPSLIKNILRDTVDLNHFDGGSKFTGGAAIYSAIALIPGKYSKLFFLDEFAKVLKRERAKNNSMETVGSAFLELYSGAAGQKSYADTTFNKKYPWQHVSLIGSATPDDLWAQITPTDLQDGFIARLQIFESRHNPRSAAYDLPLYHEHKPRHLLQTLIDIGNITLQLDPDCTGNIEQNKEDMKKFIPFKLTRTPEALEFLKFWDSNLNQKQCEYKGKWQGYIYNRARETGEKYTHVHHISKYGAKCISYPLGIDSYEYGLSLIDHLTRHILYMAESYVSENDWHAMEQKIIRAIKTQATAEKPGVSRAVLFGRFVRAPERDRKHLISGLLNTGQLCVQKYKGASGPETEILCLSKITE